MRFLTRKFGKFLKNRDGVTAVEAALCFPIILMLVFAIFQYAIFFNGATEMNKKFRDASRQVKLMNSPSTSELETLFAAQIDPDDQDRVTLNVSRVDRYGESFASVDMTYTYAIEIPMLNPFELTSSYQNLVLLSEDL